MELAREKRIDTIVARNRSRVARNTVAYLNLFENELKPLGISVVFTSESAPDFATAQGRFMETILAGKDQFWRDFCQERAYAQRKAMLEQGKWPSKAPLGYKHRKDKTLEPDEVATGVVRRIFELWLETGSISHTVRILNAEGYRIADGRRFVRGAVEKILKNRVYIGFLKNGDGWVRGGHVGIIGTDSFWLAQELFTGHKRRSPEQRCYLLGGLLVEDASGLPMTGYYATGRDKKRHYYYRVEQTYRHDTNADTSKVKVKTVPVDRIEAIVVEKLAQLADTDEIAEFEREAIKELEPILTDSKRMLSQVEDRLSQLNMAQHKVAMMVINGKAVPEGIAGDLEDEVRELLEVQNELNEVIDEYQRALGNADKLNRSLKQIKSSHASPVSWSKFEMRRILRSCVREIRVTENGINLVLMGVESNMSVTGLVGVYTELGRACNFTKRVFRKEYILTVGTLLTAAAAQAGLKANTLRQAVLRGVLRGETAWDGRIYVDESSLNDYISSR